MEVKGSARYRLVVAPLVAAACTAGGAWWLVGMRPFVAILAGVGAGAGLWAYFRHGAGAASASR